MGLVLPTEAQATPAVWNWLEGMIAGNGPIRKLLPVDVRQSMANGGGPACLRLRVVADPATVDPRFLADEAKLDRIAGVVAKHWPEAIAPGDLTSAALAALGPDAKIIVAELVPEIIDWARGPMAGLAAGCLDDPRVDLVIGDVAAEIAAGRGRYDAILLDVDNGPDGLSRSDYVRG